MRRSLLFANISPFPGVQNQLFHLCYICDFFPYKSLCWISKEIVLFSASSKDLPGLQFSCNEIAREKREGLIQQN